MKKSRIFFRPLILGQKTFCYHERASRQWNFTEIFSPQSILDTPFQMYVIASVYNNPDEKAWSIEDKTETVLDVNPTLTERILAEFKISDYTFDKNLQNLK